MSRSWTYSRIALAFALAALCGCYEGFQRPNAKADGTGGPSEKPFGLALVDVIRPSRDALLSPSCGGVPSSLADLRVQEMDARAKSLTALIDSQAAQLRVVTTEVSVEDCATFALVAGRAANALPDPELDDSLRQKIALHVRMLLWFGASPAADAPTFVTTDEWATLQRWGDLGVTRRLSVNHFVLTNTTGAYLASWQAQADPMNVFNAAVVAQPTPLEQGVADLMAVVQDSTQNFAVWLKQRASGL